jgi:hypothetical protein
VLQKARTVSKVSLCETVIQVIDKDHETLAVAKNESFWSAPCFQSVNAQSKYANASQDIREACWDHVTKIADSLTMARLYNAVPTNLMGLIQGITKEVSQDLQSGKLDAKNLNPLALGQKVLSQIQPQDFAAMSEQMMGAIGKDPSNLMRIMSSMTSMLPQDAGSSQMSGLSEIAGMVSSLQGGSFDPKMMEAMSKLPFQSLFKKDDA